jgi:hypothetical protein
MGVVTPVQPDAGTQDGTTYKSSIDGAVSVAKRPGWIFAPHEQSTPNMTVRVDAGYVWDGTTLAEVAAQSTATITAPVGNPRIDRVVVDATTGVVSVVTGTPAGSPTPPGIPANKIPIAQVLLQTSSSTITNSMITDERPFVTSVISSPALRQAFRGLTVSTHPDKDKAAAQVMLVHADEIIFDDGQRVTTGLDRLVANIASSGAGGLDTGSEVASTWYEIHAIVKAAGADPTLILHRCHDWFLDEDHSTGADTNVPLRGATAQTALGQEFFVDTSGLCPFIDINLLRTGSPTGEMWLEIHSNSGGLPSGTVLATSDKMDVSQMSATSGLVRFVFRNPANLTASTVYHVVLQANYTVSGANNVGWQSDASSPAYTRGEREDFDGSTWSNVTTQDFMFKIYIERNKAAVTMPSSYVGKALVGYVFNNSGSNFAPFLGNDRHHQPQRSDSQSTTASSGRTELKEFSALIPPMPVLMTFLVSVDTADAFLSIAPVPDGFGVPSVGGVINKGGRGVHTQEVDQVMVSGPLPTHYQAAYLSVSSGTGTIYNPSFTW